MKEKGRKNVAKMLALLLLTCLLSGCTKKDPVVEADAEQVIVEPTPNAIETVAEGNESKTKEGGDEIQLPVAPEGYVYDYQVSEEPIPEEIAALGGPVQGTIHAYPSLILKELTRLELEKDPEKKKEAEEYGEEIKAYLLERYGAECEVEIMNMESDFVWNYWCRELSTGYIFNMSYDPTGKVGRRINSDSYLLFLGSKLQTEMEYKVRKEMGDSSTIKVFFQPAVIDIFENIETIDSEKIDIDMMEKYIICLHVAVYVNEDINKLEEQKKILKLWNEIKYLNERGHILLFLCYYDDTYKDVISQQYDSSNRYDLIGIVKKKDILLEINEIKEYFYYSALSEENAINSPGENLLTILEDYENGIPITEEWNYWN